MAIAKVQVVTSDAASPTTITSTGAGNFLVVVLFGTGTTSPTFTAPTASGVTFTQMTLSGTSGGMEFGASGSAHCWARVYFAKNIPSGVTSVSWGVTTNQTFLLYEFSGVNTAPNQNGEKDNNNATQTSGNLSLTVTGTGTSGDLGFVFILARTSGGLAGNTVTAIADANSNSWQGASGVDTNVATSNSFVRIGASWASLTNTIGNVTFTETGVAFKGGCAFAFTPASPVTTIFTRRQRGWGF